MTTVVDLVPTTSAESDQDVATAIEIDLNVRVRGNQTFASFADADGDLAVNDDVEVYESESYLVGRGRVTEIDPVKGLVYVSVDWSSMREGRPQRRQRPSAIFQVYGPVLTDLNWVIHPGYTYVTDLRTHDACELNLWSKHFYTDWSAE